MRRRHQKGSLQKRKRARVGWIGMCRDAHGHRLSRNLSKYPTMSKAEAQMRLDREMAEVNQGAQVSPEVSLGDFVRNVHLPFCAGSGRRRPLPPRSRGSSFIWFRSSIARTAETAAGAIARFSRPEGRIGPVV